MKLYICKENKSGKLGYGNHKPELIDGRFYFRRNPYCWDECFVKDLLRILQYREPDYKEVFEIDVTAIRAYLLTNKIITTTEVIEIPVAEGIEL